MMAKVKKVSISPDIPKTDKDWAIHSLNIQGTFFERWCQGIIKKSNWGLISTNYPVEFPPHNGPFTGEQSALDVYAQLEKKTVLLTLLVECKKHNPEFVDWIFFNHSNESRSVKFTGTLINNKDIISSTGKISWKMDTMLTPMLSKDWVITSDAWETRGNYLAFKNNSVKTKTSNAAISLAAHQIALATKSIINEEIKNNDVLKKADTGIKPPYKNQLFIPAIVTTAKLFTCEYEPKEIDGKTGEIPFSKASLKEQPYLLYEYPLPVPFHSEPMDKYGVIKSGNKDFGNRMDILIINSSNFLGFLSMMDELNY